MSLLLPGSSLPSSIRLKEGVKAKLVESDLFDIGRRLQELDQAIYAVELSEGDRAAWAVMEDCRDGVQRLIFKTDCLDARVIEKVQRLMHVPFEQRLKEAEKEIADADAKRKEEELEQLYERMGRPMLTQLEHDGFIQRPVSYAKRGMYGRHR